MKIAHRILMEISKHKHGAGVWKVIEVLGHDDHNTVAVTLCRLVKDQYLYKDGYSACECCHRKYLVYRLATKGMMKVNDLKDGVV